VDVFALDFTFNYIYYTPETSFRFIWSIFWSCI